MFLSSTTTPSLRLLSPLKVFFTFPVLRMDVLLSSSNTTNIRFAGAHMIDRRLIFVEDKVDHKDN